MGVLLGRPLGNGSDPPAAARLAGTGIVEQRDDRLRSSIAPGVQAIRGDLAGELGPP